MAEIIFGWVLPPWNCLRVYLEKHIDKSKEIFWMYNRNQLNTAWWAGSYVLRMVESPMFSIWCATLFATEHLNLRIIFATCLNLWGENLKQKSRQKNFETCPIWGFVCFYLHADSHENPHVFRRALPEHVCIKWSGQLFTGPIIRKPLYSQNFLVWLWRAMLFAGFFLQEILVW